VQYSLKNWAILAIYSPGKMFLTPKMVHWPKIFWRRGGGRVVAEIFRKWSGTKLWNKGPNNLQVFNHLNLAALYSSLNIWIWQNLQKWMEMASQIV
jgi:hypothetical protein